MNLAGPLDTRAEKITLLCLVNIALCLLSFAGYLAEAKL